MKRSFLMAAVAIVGLAYAPIAAADHHEGCDDAKSAAHAEMGCEATSAAHAKMLEMDIVEVAVHAGSFNTLVAAVQAAGLVDTLKGEGPFTVFAPTDEAFAKIPKDQLEALLADKERLTAVLTYHVVPGRVMAADVVKLDSARTVQGQSVTISNDMGVKIDGARVVHADIPASNGVIHIIDAVILPEA